MRSLLVVAFTLLSLLVGCSSPSVATGTVVVGVTSELRAGVDIKRMRVALRVGGAVAPDRIFDEQNEPLAFPTEIRLSDLEDGTEIAIAIDAYGSNARRPLVVRAASTEVVGGKVLLLRLRLDAACVIPPDGSTCPEAETCVAGACGDGHVDPGRLEPYSSDWSTGAADACKPASGGDPTVLVGEGQGDYLPLQDGDEAQLEAGPQGGHHIWVAVRMKNLRQSGSITSIGGYVPELDVTIDPFKVIFTFDPDEGGYCTLAGLRFQVDGPVDVERLLGKEVDVEVTVTDRDGDVGTGRRRVKLSQDIL